MSFESLVRNDASDTAAAPARRGFSLELRRPTAPVVGGMPSVSLLPKELRDAERNKTLRRGSVAALGAVVVVMALAIAGSTFDAAGAQARLDAETQRTPGLTAQVAKFSDVQQLQQRISVGDAAVRVGSSTAIDWQKQLEAVTAVMPDGFTITTITADGATPIADYAQGTTPIDKPRAATVLITAESSSIDELPDWLRELRSIPAYADVVPTVSGTDGAGFNVLLTLHLSPKALITPVAKGAAQ